MLKQTTSAEGHNLSKSNEEENKESDDETRGKRSRKKQPDSKTDGALSEDDKFNLLLKQNQALIDLLKKR